MLLGFINIVAFHGQRYAVFLHIDCQNPHGNYVSELHHLGGDLYIFIGYMQNGEGKAGLEKLYDEQLSGTNGLEIYIEDSNGQKKQSLAVRSQTDGKDLTTTINSSLQKAIYEQYKNDKSAHVALNPSTGEVKALVSTPSYDAQAFILGMSQ